MCVKFASTLVPLVDIWSHWMEEGCFALCDSYCQAILSFKLGLWVNSKPFFAIQLLPGSPELQKKKEQEQLIISLPYSAHEFKNYVSLLLLIKIKVIAIIIIITNLFYIHMIHMIIT